MFCGSGTNVKADADGVTAVPLRCRRWSCADCLPGRRAGVARQVKAGEPQLFVTLTCLTDDTKSQDERAQELRRAWNIIVKRWKRTNPGKTLPYMAVIEATKQGWPHLHIVCRAKWLSQAWLSKQMQDVTGAYICWVTALRSAAGGAKYISKYLGKEPHHFEHCKRYWSSLDWIVDRAAWDEEKQRRYPGWCRTQHPIIAVAEDMIEAGYAIRWTDKGEVIGTAPASAIGHGAHILHDFLRRRSRWTIAI